MFSHLLFGNHIGGMRELITLLIVFLLLAHIAPYPLCSMGCFYKYITCIWENKYAMYMCQGDLILGFVLLRHVKFNLYM